jgi:hypothetical protein
MKEIKYFLEWGGGTCFGTAWSGVVSLAVLSLTPAATFLGL